MALTKRVEILFDPEEFMVIEELARTQGEPVAALVRRAVAEKYLEADLVKRRAGADRLLSIQTDVTWEEAKAILENDVRRTL